MKNNLHALEKLRPGAHLCLIYETEEEFRGAVAPFLIQGLERGEKVGYITSSHTACEVLENLRDAGLAPDDFLSKKQLVMLSSKETYLKGGVFRPDAMIETLLEMEETALSEGYSALRVAGEMSWVLPGAEGGGRLIEYESKLNRFLPGSKCLALCQYDKNKFRPEVLLDVLRTHPVLLTGAGVRNNFYYVPPEEFLGGSPAERELSRWIDNLVNSRVEAASAFEGIVELFRELFDGARLMLFVFSPVGRLEYANRACGEYIGKRPEELIGKNFTDLIPANERGKVKNNCMSLTPDSPSVTLKHRLKTAAGIIPCEWAYRAFFKENGDISFFYAVCPDITRYEQGSERELAEERMAGAGEVAAGIAHVLRNYLSNVSSAAQSLAGRFEFDEFLSKYFSIIVKNTEGANRVISDLLDFARPGEVLLKPASVRGVVESAVKSAKEQCPVRGVRIISRTGRGLPPVLMDETLLKNAFVKIITNALEAMPGGGDLRIKVSRDSRNGKIAIHFIDSGSGISPEHIGKIFAPFFSTKRGRAGLGLSIARQVVFFHKGDVDVESRGRGSEVKVSLPAVPPGPGFDAS